MKVKVIGVSGYLGKLISDELALKGYNVSPIKRSFLYGLTEKLKNEISGTDVIINLAGAPIFQRWTKKNRKLIYDSRIITTQNLVRAINELPETSRPKKFIAASAIGIYKSGYSHDESSNNFDEEFLGEVVTEWEKQSTLLHKNTQRIIYRIGPVLGKKSKTINNLLLPFKLGLGATIGSGKQPFPFIHEKDLVNAFIWAIEEYSGNDTFNLVAPQKITNREFTFQLAKQLHRPVFFTLPEFLLKLIFGKASELITQSPEVLSDKIQKAGFNFQYQDIAATLHEIVNKNS